MDDFAQPLVLFTLILIATLSTGYLIADVPIVSSSLSDLYGNALLLSSIVGACASMSGLLICRRATCRRFLLILLAFFTGAFLLARDLHKDASSDVLADILGEDRLEAVVEGQVVTAPIPYEAGWAFEIRATHLDDKALHAENPPRLRIFYPIAIIKEHETYDQPVEPPLLPLPGDTVEGFMRLERFALADLPADISMRQLMENRGLAARANAREVLLVSTPARLSLRHQLERRLAARRIHLEREIGTRLPADQAAVATGMLTASRGLITPEFRHPFDLTGTSHLLAISGLHLTVLAGILWVVLGWLIGRIPWLMIRFGKKRVCGPAVVLLLSTYVLMIGAPVSAQRALVMLTIAICGYTTLRPFCGLHAISLAALFLTFLQPTILFELGFQLSFLATAGIILFMRNRPSWLRSPEPGMPEDTRTIALARRFANFVGISFAATLSTWPAIVIITGELPVAGLWLNVLVVPIFSVVIFPIMTASALLLPVVPEVAEPFLYASSLCITLMQQGLDIAAYWPGSTIRIGNPSVLSWMAGTLSILLLILGGLSRRAFLLAMTTAFIACLSFWCGKPANLPPMTRVHFIPVGQGDSTLVEFPDGTTMLIDAGGTQMGADPGLHRVLPYLKYLGIRHLDYVVLTHADQDHMGGLPALIRPFRPRYFIFDAEETSAHLAQISAKMQKYGATLLPISHSLELPLADTTVRVIRPIYEERGSTNNMSLVTSFQYAGAAVLLPGDIEEPGETWLLENQLLQRHTIVKLPHHGSKTSSTLPFLQELQPRIAIAPVGRHNQFGHPHPDIVQRYLKLGASIYRTDHNGLITLEITNNGEITVRTMR